MQRLMMSLHNSKRRTLLLNLLLQLPYPPDLYVISRGMSLRQCIGCYLVGVGLQSALHESGSLSMSCYVQHFVFMLGHKLLMDTNEGNLTLMEHGQTTHFLVIMPQ